MIDQMEKLLLCIIILKSLDVCSQEYRPRDFKCWGFERINDGLIAFKNPERFADVITSKRYTYWEVIYHDSGDNRGRVIWRYGDSARYASTILGYSSDTGLITMIHTQDITTSSLLMKKKEPNLFTTKNVYVVSWEILTIL